MFRTLGLVSGKDVRRPAPFVPAGARFSDLIAVNDRVYAATSNGCGGAADGIWSIDIVERHEARCFVEDQRRLSHRVGRLRHQWHRHRGDWAWHCHGRRLRQRDRRAGSEDARFEDWFRQPGVEFAAPPVVFQESGKDIVAVTTRDGRILLLDTGSLGGTNHDTPLFASASLTGGAATFAAQSPAMWEERAPSPPSRDGACCFIRAVTADGARWLLIPIAGPLPGSLGAAGNGAVSSGAILGVKLAHQDGKFWFNRPGSRRTSRRR